MKKKGLIISTVVMVVVLIASLTTATFAWFTQSATATIDSIAFQVGAGADLLIGVSGTNNFVETPTNASFYSGTTVYEKGAEFKDQGTWTGDVNALGVNIDLNNLNLSNISKAVGTGTFTGNPGSWDGNTYTSGTNLGGTADVTFNNANYKIGMIKAEGQSTAVDTATIDTAWKNFDYLDVVIGVQATKANLQSMTCYVTVNPGAGTIIGMNAAIHVAYELVKPAETATNTLTDNDVYGTSNSYATKPNSVNNTTYTTAKAAYDAAKKTTSTGLTCLGGAGDVTLNPGAMTFPIELDKVTSGAIDVSGIYQLHLVIYVAGFDGDCLEAAKGVSSTIYITFAGVEAAA